MQRKIIPDIVTGQTINSAKVDTTVMDVAKQMAGAHIAAITVEDDDGMLIGIITERDITQRVVAKGLNAETTSVSDVMTKNPDTLSPNDSAGDALELMQSRNYRHLPVTENGKCIAMVSIRDLYKAAKEQLEENIRETEAFVFGDRYGA